MSTLDWDLAVVDMAGTTISDNGIIVSAITESLTEVAPGHQVDLEVVNELRGAAKTELFATLVPDQPERAVEAFNRSLRRLVLGGHIQPTPGAADTIRSLREDGVSVCLVTGFDRSIADVMIEHLDWTDLADDVITATEAGRGRPHPDLVLSAALRAGVASMSRVVVCGDTVNDLLSGANAGAGLLVGVLTGAHDRAALQAVPRAVIVDSVANLPGVL